MSFVNFGNNYGLGPGPLQTGYAKQAIVSRGETQIPVVSPTQQLTTFAIGEEGGNNITSNSLGEEGGGVPPGPCPQPNPGPLPCPYPNNNNNGGQFQNFFKQFLQLALLMKLFRGFSG